MYIISNVSSRAAKPILISWAVLEGTSGRFDLITEPMASTAYIYGVCPTARGHQYKSISIERDPSAHILHKFEVRKHGQKSRLPKRQEHHRLDGYKL